jgi:hypothetical protein
MKDWETYCTTRVYCPTLIMNRCKVWEKCAREMATTYNGEVVSRDHYLAPMKEMEEGQDAIDNIRVVRKKVVKEKSSDTDKTSRVFSTQENAVKFGKTMRIKSTGKFVCFYRRPPDRDGNFWAPDTLIRDGENPTREYLVERMWGLDEDKPARMIITNTGKWCVYWRPSLVTTEEEEVHAEAGA